MFRHSTCLVFIMLFESMILSKSSENKISFPDNNRLSFVPLFCHRMSFTLALSFTRRHTRGWIPLRGGSNIHHGFEMNAAADHDSSVVANLQIVHQQIAALSTQLGRVPPRLVAVSKFQSEESITQAYHAGQVMISLQTRVRIRYNLSSNIRTHFIDFMVAWMHAANA